jgi:L-alanine-DL-glutamate epimerase-like enolase superfamily enzyme
MDAIGRITVHHVAYPEPNDLDRVRRIVLARVQTKAGLVGWGECISGSAECSEAVRVVIEQGLAPLLRGRDPQDVRARWRDMRTATWWYGHGGIANFAISALDMALWDIAGKAAGLPVHRLLGGKLTDRVPAAASIIWDPGDLDWTRAEVKAAVAAGFRTIKCGWGRTHGASFGLDAKRDLAAVAAVREEIGTEIAFAADVAAIANWTADHAVRMAQAFESFQLAWLEDPLDHSNVNGYRRIRAVSSAPLATGERMWTHESYRSLVGTGAVDIVLIDPGRVEGLTGMLIAAEHAHAAGVRFVPHSWSSALNTAAALHVFASRPSGAVFQLKLRPSPMQHELVAQPFEPCDGWIRVPDAPGLGCEVDETVVSRYEASRNR